MTEYIRSTIGLQSSHDDLKRPTLIRAEFYRNNDDSVTIKAVSGHNLSPIRSIKNVTISADEYNNSPDDPYDDSVEALWALRKLNCNI